MIPRPRKASEPVLKVLTSAQWSILREVGQTDGAPIDISDGFVHLSTPQQVARTIELHFGGQSGLWVLTLDADELGDALKWEPSRGGALFPHLYGPLRLADVCAVEPWQEND